MRTQFPLFSVEINREAIPVETLLPSKVPDEKWKHVDSHGHGHFWSGEELPTLKWVVTGTEWYGDEYESFEEEIGEYHCRQCGEIVEPGRRTEYSSRIVLGLARITVTIDGEKFSLNEDEYARSIEAWAESLRGIRE